MNSKTKILIGILVLGTLILIFKSLEKGSFGTEFKENQVTITTDKTEYKQGDIVIITIQNKGRKKVEICGLSKCAGLATLHTNVEEYKEGEWKAITGYCPTVRFKRDKDSIIKDDLLCYSLAPKDLLTFSIPSFLSDYKIDESKRVRVVYYIDNKESPIYSNEFIIKERCAKAGELVNYPPGTNKYLPDVCCEGLKPLAGFEVNEKGECERVKGGPFLTCMPCGNGVCETINNFDENKCNCPEDCK